MLLVLLVLAETWILNAGLSLGDTPSYISEANVLFYYDVVVVVDQSSFLPLNNQNAFLEI